MITRDVIELISRPNEIDAEHAEELEQLVSRYPWFAAGHILLAKAYKNSGRHSYKSLLKKASLYAGDRSLLFNLMEDDAFLNDDSFEESPAQIINVKEGAPAEMVAVDGDSVAPEPSTSDPEPKEEIVDTRKEERKNEPSSGHAIEDFLKSFKDEPPVIEPEKASSEKEPTEPEPMSEEEQILEELHHIAPDVNEVVEEMDTEDSEVSEIPEEIPFMTGSSSDANDDNQTEEHDQISEGENDKSIPEPIYDPIKELGKLTPVDDLEGEGREFVPFVPAYNPEVELSKLIGSGEEESEEDSDSRSFLYWLDGFGAEDKKEKENDIAGEEPRIEVKKAETGKKADPTELLESFIKNRPQISRMKVEFYNPESMARKSESDDSDIVSETLAKLLLKQGHPVKAIEVYEKLRLQKPTNLAYFAARIAEIKEKYNIG